VRTVVGLVLGQLGAVTALAFYFGWVRTSAYLQYFGLDTSMVDFSTADYVLRSVGAAYWPLMWLGLLVVLALAAHARICAVLARDGTRGDRHLATIAAVGVGLLGVAVAGLFDVWIFPPRIPVIPLLLTAGFALIAYSWALHSIRPAPGEASLVAKAQIVALCGLIAGGLFWAWGSYANTVGERTAQQTADALADRTEVPVFSARRLALSGPGVHVDRIDDEESLYRFRYTGLRLLLRSDDRYFLLPKDWERGQGSVFVLSESDEVRLEFFAPP
jgi:hypothetical protein